MAFCKFCGKEIPDGKVCECRKKKIDEFNAWDIKQTANENKRQLIIGAVCIAVMIFALAGIISFIFSGKSEEPVVRTTGREYERPVDEFVSAYNKNNSERMMKAILPSDYINSVKKEIGDFQDWNDYTDGLNEAIESKKDALEIEYGKNITMSVEFLDRKSVKRTELERLEKIYIDNFGAKGIKTAYKVKVEIEISGLDDSESNKYWIYVVEVRGDGWLLSPENDELILSDYIGIEQIIEDKEVTEKETETEKPKGKIV